MSALYGVLFYYQRRYLLLWHNKKGTAQEQRYIAASTLPDKVKRCNFLDLYTFRKSYRLIGFLTYSGYKMLKFIVIIRTLLYSVISNLF